MAHCKRARFRLSRLRMINLRMWSYRIRYALLERRQAEAHRNHHPPHRIQAMQSPVHSHRTKADRHRNLGHGIVSFESFGGSATAEKKAV